MGNASHWIVNCLLTVWWCVVSIRMPILICVSLFTAGAADRVIVHPAQLAGPYGSDTGKLVIVGNQMVFVDDVNPANSFVIPRTDIRGYNVSNGMVTFNMQQPYTLPMGSGSALVLRFMEPNSPNEIATWVGVPPTPAGSANRVIVGAP